MPKTPAETHANDAPAMWGDADRDERIQNLLAVVDRAVRMLNRKGAVQDLWPE